MLVKHKKNVKPKSNKTYLGNGKVVWNKGWFLHQQLVYVAKTAKRCYIIKSLKLTGFYRTRMYLAIEKSDKFCFNKLSRISLDRI